MTDALRQLRLATGYVAALELRCELDGGSEAPSGNVVVGVGAVESSGTPALVVYVTCERPEKAFPFLGEYFRGFPIVRRNAGPTTPLGGE